jgi:hypothetical protein
VGFSVKSSLSATAVLANLHCFLAVAATTARLAAFEVTAFMVLTVVAEFWP